MQNMDKMIDELQAKWDLPWVLRVQAKKASGGVFDTRTVRLAENRGKGPKNRFKIGMKIAWPKEDFYEWLREQMSE